MRKLWLVALIFLWVGGGVSAAQQFTYLDLINRLTDLECLSVLPLEGERCSQWSSWDRTSRYDATSSKYIDWDANADGQGVIRSEGDQLVMAEMDGPGCIWRIWSASPKAGNVKIYLDGSSEPAVDLPFSGYFDRKNAPFIYPSLVYDASQGKNCYIPIPYAKSCKVVADQDWGNYYHFNYTTFPKRTIVPTFKRELSPEEIAALERADQFLTGKIGTDPAGKRNGEITESRNISIPPGGKSTAIKLEGPRAITCIKAKVNPSLVSANPDALREVVIRITWDGEKTPAVWTPLIDFFGTAPSANLYKSLPAGVTTDGFYSYWYMPFTKEAMVEFENGGSSAFPLDISITSAPLNRDIKGLGRFHAKWHRDAFLPAITDRWLDWTMLKTEGCGRLCGMAMHLWVPTGGWWGEGDEKFFVDGEKFPSTFGTGSEDYFGYAWGNPALFQRAYHNQTRSDDNAGHVSLNRWHITDNIPFRKSFEGFIEKYRSNARPALYACTAYWYLAPDGVDPYGPVPLKERVGYCVIPSTLTLEGEKLGVLNMTGGKTVQQSMGGNWSEGSNFEWQEVKSGDELTFALPVKTGGRHKLLLKLTKSPDYGVIQLMLDGTALGGPIDLYNPNLVPTGEIVTETPELSASEHRLSVKLISFNERSTKNSGFGLDYIKLAPSR